VVRRHDVPGRVFLGGRVDAVLEGGLVGIPVFALGIVALGELPVLLRLVDAVEEALGLFLLGDVQEDLHDANVVVPQILLKAVDVLIAALHDLREVNAVRIGLALPELLHLVDQDLLIMGAVEDGDVALGRHAAVDTVQIIMGQIIGAGRLEGLLDDAVRRQAGQNGADGAVLAGGVHGLEDEDDALFFLGVELLLELINLRHVLLHLLLRFLAVGAELCFAGGSAADVEPFGSVESVFFIHVHIPLL